MITFDRNTLTLTYDYGCMGYVYRFQKMLEDVRSDYQRITVLQHARLGKTVLLNDDIMSSELDNDYDDGMLSLCPDGAETALILGGGDGSLARLLSQRPFMRWITVVEIDSMVIQIFRKHFPGRWCEGGNVQVVNDDAFRWIGYSPTMYDVVFDDMFTEPLGESSAQYRSLLMKRFRGVPIISQTDSLNAGVADKIRNELLAITPDVTQVSRFVATYMENWTFTRYRLK